MNDPVDKAGEEDVANDEGVAGMGGGASNYPLISWVD